MAAKRNTDQAQTGMDAGAAPQAPRLRLKLNTIDDVKCELARLYREGKAGRRDMADVSKLGNLLGILGRLIVDHEWQSRVEALEERVNLRR